jgi:type I restriction enzyme, S subunit
MDKEGIVPQENSKRKDNSNSDKSKYLRVVPGDIAYNTMRMWEGRSAYVALEGLVSPAYTVCTPNAEAHSLFFAYYFKHPLLIEQFRRYSQGLVKDTLTLKYEAFSRIAAFAPSYPEQQKIADCLSSVDELLAAQARKIDALKTYKRGLMQQLFPRPERIENGIKLPAETQPRLRLPEFQDAGEWETKKAGSLFKNRIAKGEQGLPIYSVTMHDGMVRRDTFDRNFYDIENAAGNKKACKDDVVYNMMRMWQGALGVAPEDCLVSPAYIVLEPLRGTVPDFFRYMFKLPQTLLLLTSHSQGLTKDRLRLYHDDFASISLRCPAAAEQRRIADCLTSLDDLIGIENQKLDTLKLHKIGLMQQLFPSAKDA